MLAAGRKPMVHTKLENDVADAMARAHSRCASTTAGRLHISEKSTKDGGYVSVGTDITAIKLHEEKLVESERPPDGDNRRSARSQQALQTNPGTCDFADKYGRKNRAEEASSRSQNSSPT